MVLSEKGLGPLLHSGAFKFDAFYMRRKWRRNEKLRMKCPFTCFHIQIVSLFSYLAFTFCLSDVLLFLLSYRPARGESDNAGVLPRWSDVCRNSRSAFPLSNGRQRDGVYHSHHKTRKRYNMDQIPHGPAWISNPLSHMDVHLATSNTPFIT